LAATPFSPVNRSDFGSKLSGAPRVAAVFVRSTLFLASAPRSGERLGELVAALQLVADVAGRHRAAHAVGDVREVHERARAVAFGRLQLRSDSFRLRTASIQLA
jgi:hypothetical protein